MLSNTLLKWKKMQNKTKKTKILQIITKLAVGGAQENTLYLAEKFNDENYYSEIACGKTAKEFGSLEEIAGKAGIRITIVDGLSNDFRPIKYIGAILKLRKYIKENNFDIVHTHSSAAGILGRIAAKFAGAKIIVHTVHGWGFSEDMNFFKKQIYLLLERISAKFTDKLISVSNDAVNVGLKNKIGDKNKYVIIRSGIPLEKFSRKINFEKTKKELNIPKNYSVVGTIGRLDEQKNPLDFVETARIVLHEKKNTVFVIVGDGPLRQKVENKIKRLGIKENFRVLGFRNDVNEIIHIFDVFVLTSLWEGMPRVIVEAMAAKKPIVANDVGGVRDALKNGCNGFLIAKHCPAKTAEKVLYLIEHNKEKEKMGEKGRIMAEEFSEKRTFLNIKDLFKDLEKI
jgi:glycosyltransferase involved in cell wall biosynthesis